MQLKKYRRLKHGLMIESSDEQFVRCSPEQSGTLVYL